MFRNHTVLKRLARCSHSFIRIAAIDWIGGVGLVLFMLGCSVAEGQQPATFKEKPPELEKRPEAEWINSPPLKLSELRGRVVIMHFWTFGCINCYHNQPSYKKWFAEYSKKGVTMIGVHTPETERERKIENVRKSVEKNKLKYPIVIDGDHKIWNAWGNRWWPSVYLIDKQGFARYRWDGELNWEGTKGDAIMREKIDELLAEPAPAEDSAEKAHPKTTLNNPVSSGK